MARKKAIAESGSRKGESLQVLSAEAEAALMRETANAVARRAFEIFESGGRRGGRNMEDWLQAEAELVHPVHIGISDSGTALTVTAEVPGFTKGDLEIRVDPRRLTISGERKPHVNRKTGRTVYSERCANRIVRVVDLPAEVDAESRYIRATCDKGILTLVLPKAKSPIDRQSKAKEAKG